MPRTIAVMAVGRHMDAKCPRRVTHQTQGGDHIRVTKRVGGAVRSSLGGEADDGEWWWCGRSMGFSVGGR